MSAPAEVVEIPRVCARPGCEQLLRSNNKRGVCSVSKCKSPDVRPKSPPSPRSRLSAQDANQLLKLIGESRTAEREISYAKADELRGALQAGDKAYAALLTHVFGLVDRDELFQLSVLSTEGASDQ